MKIRLKSGRYINGFTKEVLNKFEMTNEQIKIIIDYQEVFPELLQNHHDNEFVIDSRNLWKQLEKPYTKFDHWMTRKVLQIRCEENREYKIYDEFKRHEELFKTFEPVHNSVHPPTTGGKKSPTPKESDLMKKYDDSIRDTPYGEVDLKTFVRKYIGRQPMIDYRFSIDFAKHVCMSENTDKGYKFRQYFINVERAFRKQIDWDNVRVGEKHNYIELMEALEQHSTASDAEKQREANMLNRSLTGYSAEEIRDKLGIIDIWTRDHLDAQINKVLDELQKFDILLIQSGQDFKNRKKMMENLCVSKYLDLKGKIVQIKEREVVEVEYLVS